MFRPVSRLPAGELESVAAQVLEVLDELHNPSNIVVDTPILPRRIRDLIQAANEYRRVPEIQARDEEAFRALWKLHYPIIVKGASLHGDWTAEGLVKPNGDNLVAVVVDDGTDSIEFDTTLPQFLEHFRAPGSKSYRLKVRLCMSTGSGIDDCHTGLPAI